MDSAWVEEPEKEPIDRVWLAECLEELMARYSHEGDRKLGRQINALLEENAQLRSVGFTRDDLPRLREKVRAAESCLARDVAEERDGIMTEPEDGSEPEPAWLGEPGRRWWRDEAQFYRSLADRIEALLPPE